MDGEEVSIEGFQNKRICPKASGSVLGEAEVSGLSATALGGVG